MFPPEPSGSRVTADSGTCGGRFASAAGSSRAPLRSQMRHRRRCLSKAERARCARGVVRVLLGSGLLWRSHRVACYLAEDGELDLAPLFPRLHAMGKLAYLPALHGRRLLFLPYGPGTPLVRNRFDIPEPDLPPAAACPPQALELVLVPLVAFDDDGNRLGRGGGYYDRTFAYLQHRRHWRTPPLLGVAYEFQRVAALPARPWDIPLQGAITERTLHRFR